MKVTYSLPISFDRKQTNILLLVILIVTAVIYIPVFNNQFTNWDDELYILNNPYLKRLSPQNLKSIFTAYYAGNYHPLTLLSLAIDFKLGGIKPWPYQLTNLLLHLGNTLLVYVFIKRLLQLKFPNYQNYALVSLITAVLFGIHTFQVESVAWVSERKNLLYVFFFLSSLILYLRYINNKSWKNYILSIALFILSLLSKGMAVPLSACVIVIDYFAGRQLLSKKVIWEKVPFILLSLIFGYIAIRAQHSGDAIRTENHFLWINQIAIACYGFIQYLVKLCFPFHLAAFYPYPAKTEIFLPIRYYAYILLASSLLFILWRYFRHHTVILFGALFFLINISIVIQLLPVGDAFMADRYVYLPSIGFFFIIGFYSHALWQKSTISRIIVLSLFSVYCLVLSVKTYHRVGVWKDSMSLWNDALENYPVNNDRGFQNRGNIFFDRGNYTEALENYNKVLQIRPPNNKAFSKAYIGKARIKQAMNDFQGAMDDFNTSLAYLPSYDAYLDRAVLKIEQGDIPGALNDLDKATLLNPLSVGSFINKGGIFYQTGNYTEALNNFDHVLQIDPQNSKAYIGKGQIKQAMNDIQGALNDFNTALSFGKSYEGYLNRAVLKIERKDFFGALADLDKASHIDSISAELYINRGVVYLNSGDVTQALKEFNKAVEMDNINFLVYLYRAIAENSLTDYQGAISDLDVSIQLHPSAEAYYYRGMAYKQLGRASKAYGDFKQSASMGNAAAKAEMKQNGK
jgi:tetratricopeptide (TPR) repeat protein